MFFLAAILKLHNKYLQARHLECWCYSISFWEYDLIHYDTLGVYLQKAQMLCEQQTKLTHCASIFFPINFLGYTYY